MSNTITSVSNGVVVVTHVQPVGKDVGGAGVSSTPQSLVQRKPVSVQRIFRMGHPKALGTIQIMIGFIVLLIGIAMAAARFPDNVVVLSGIFAWGAIIYIIAGSLTVAADNHLSACLVKGSLAMNVLAVIISLVGIILYSLDTAGLLLSSCNNLGSPNNEPSIQNYPSPIASNTNHNPSDSDSSHESSSHDGHRSLDTPYLPSDCQKYWIRSRGISGVLVIFSFLAFIVSICASSFACKAVCQCCCCHTPEEVIIPVPYDNQLTPGSAPLPPSYESVKNEKDLEGEGMEKVFQEYDQFPKYPPVIIP
ncbi:hypothetical protein UPYG_G00096470 [Umbra pygmaea]|uniref:Uncharacterized protein n=1 Tax=Umbra pygmaea TaxID=75934 RepID=A0ABD0XKF2_UMBPY